MGRTHALTGLCAGLALAPAVADTVAETVVLAVVTAGFALLPDLDHPRARASRLLGPVTGMVSAGMRAGSRWLYARTKGPRDERHRGEHRHATHTVAFAALVGMLVAVGTWGFGAWWVVGTVLLGIALAVDALGDWLLPVVGIAGIVWWGAAGGDLAGAFVGIGPVAGIAAGVGCVTHCLGDACTVSGCPFLWPIPIAGETWFEIRPPRWLRFRTGGWVEHAVVFPAFSVAAVLLVPGAWPLAATMLG